MQLQFIKCAQPKTIPELIEPLPRLQFSTRFKISGERIQSYFQIPLFFPFDAPVFLLIPNFFSPIQRSRPRGTFSDPLKFLAMYQSRLDVLHGVLLTLHFILLFLSRTSIATATCPESKICRK